MESDLENELMDLLKLLNSDDKEDVKLGVGVFNAQYYAKSIKFPVEFKQGLKPKWKNFSLEYKRDMNIPFATSYTLRVLGMKPGNKPVVDKEENVYYIYLI